MKKLILALAECCAFFSQGISMNSDAKLNSIERLEKKINVLKAERENIKHKLSSIQDELSVVEKKKETFKGKIKKPNLYNPEVFACQYFKTMLEKIENDVKKLRLLVAQYKSLLDSDKIDLSIDKAKIELIKAEIKAGKTPYYT